MQDLTGSEALNKVFQLIFVLYKSAVSNAIHSVTLLIHSIT